MHTDIYMDKKYSYIYQVGLICVFSNLRLMRQYTKWNLVFSLLQRPLGIEPAVLFLNSITTWLGFQFGATDGTKHRLIKQMKLPNIASFVCFDILGHLLPTLGWGYVVFHSKRKIKPLDIINQSLWVMSYYGLVVKGFYARKQYKVEYPYKRQVFQACAAPIFSCYIMNQAISGNLYPFLGSLAVGWHSKDYLDLCDTSPTRKLPAYYQITK